MPNPFLPLNTYIADGEPHVFGDRVYLFGSHDKEGGDTYCMLDYEFWSAPVTDLNHWSSKGISYSARQDPLYSEKLQYMYAPDVVQGNDGRFYLYYCMSGKKGAGGYGQPISVAVCDTPDGKYEYYGFVRNPDGSPMLKYVTFDPAVINDNGVVRLYYGTWYPFHEHGKLLDGIFHMVESRMFGKSISEIKAYKDCVMGAIHAELADDMLTLQSEPVPIMPSRVKGTTFQKHPFFEASSIRKIGDTYYFLYSSSRGHELCYATSPYPDKDFTYGGSIVSNGDVGYHGRTEKDRLNTTGTNHGSIVCIKGQWYVFYHRNTNKTAYSRQACAEPIEILPNGTIPQVAISSQGFCRNPLDATGTYPAAICCNLTNKKMPHQGNGIIRKKIPYITCENGEQIVVATNNTRIVYKYFDFSNQKTRLNLCYKAGGTGKLTIKVSGYHKPVAVITVSQTKNWTPAAIECNIPAGVHALTFLWQSKFDLRLSKFTMP
ncbi:MAG: family 43 glycosylhydrolase [Lachnospiraceae bacterium]|nr:family 43 glycosylhydrolase [Lachnospiraceae bacterium]